jgi:hypothetical protein
VEQFCTADVVIVPASILEEEHGKVRPYTQHLSRKAGSKLIPPAPKSYSQREAPTIEGMAGLFQLLSILIIITLT